MIRRCAQLALLVTLAPLSAQSQITLTAADYPFPVGETITTNALNASPAPGTAAYNALQTLGNAVGDNQTWDLRPVSFSVADALVSRVNVFDAGGPGGSVAHFASATYRVDVLIADNPGSTDEVHSFQTVDNTGIRNYGAFQNIGGQEQVLTNEPFDLSTMLPLTTGSQWVSDYTQTTAVIGYSYVQQLTSTHTVEGWGTLITPDGTSLDCLRLRKVTEIKDGSVTLATLIRVEFLTKQGRGAALDFDSFVTNQWQTIRYSEKTVGGATGVQAVSGDLPMATILLQNFPNPAAHTTTIEFAVAEATTVRLNVFDVLGREVARPVDEVLPAGTYRTAVALSDLPVGTYFYRLQAGGLTVTRRMIVVR